ncbi:MAG TPA: arginine decarboxylase [Phaeodactylibacter sp.]|nr:arginine decarboxylase [Phaeodactylibacter sp.]
MANKYLDLIEQTFRFPQEGFVLENDCLTFHGVPLKYLIEKYGTPLRLSYLPKIGQQIRKARELFLHTMKGSGYGGKYYYCYCTKSNHFSYVLDEVLRHKAHLETSSEFDIDLILRLHKAGKISRDEIIIHNGFKPQGYIKKIAALLQRGFINAIPVLDNMEELQWLNQAVQDKCKLGIRIATEEVPNFSVYTSRHGIRSSEVLPFYRQHILSNKNFELTMLHFFVDTGISDSLYYWGELKKAIRLYCELKKLSPSLHAFNIGGGMPIAYSLDFDFDYNYMVGEIIRLIAEACQEAAVPEPDIFTEFGSYTVGESGAVLFSVLGQKKQNDSELWYMIDNSLMNSIPDSWGIAQRFILLPVNKWQNEYTRVNIGGLSCDSFDFYNSEVHKNQVYLPVFDPKDSEPLYIGFFHNGAYQDAISGYGGIKHCLIPAPKQVLIRRDEEGRLVDALYRGEQEAEGMLDILGY